MASYAEVAATLMEHLCTHDYHGYSQGARWGDGEGYCDVEVDGKTYQVAQGDRDCSSAIISAYQAAGLDVDATYTGNMRAGFLATGMFTWEPMSFTAQRGDIYLNEECHTAMCTSADPDLLAEFSISETGGIYGEVGDQTGAESHITNYYDYPWDGILHFTGGEASGGGSRVNGQEAGDRKNTLGMAYRAHVANLGWLDVVHDGQTAGTTGNGYQMEALKIDPPDGVVLEVKAHIANVGFKTYSGIETGSNRTAKQDPTIGTTGKSQAIEGLTIRTTKNTTGKTLRFQAHQAGIGWTSVAKNGEFVGSEGNQRPIEAVRIWME